jgi:hypothetical protein
MSIVQEQEARRTVHERQCRYFQEELGRLPRVRRLSRHDLLNEIGDRSEREGSLHDVMPVVMSNQRIVHFGASTKQNGWHLKISKRLNRVRVQVLASEFQDNSLRFFRGSSRKGVQTRR